MNLKRNIDKPSIGTSILDRPVWQRLTPATFMVLLIMLGSAVLHFINIQTIGDANTYYTAAVKSMLQSWHNFFFVAAEPGASVSVDKPPLGLWIEAAFAFVLGVNGLAVSLPNILAGILGIPILYQLVRKYLGTLAGLVASLVYAITPVVLATDRNNTMDGMLAFTLVLAAWAFIKAVESGRLRWLLLGGGLVGLGFNIKMMEAFLPLPAFCALYFLGSKTSWWRKIVHITLMSLVLAVVSLSWAVAVELTPADQRPYIGGSSNNSVFDLMLGYNGIDRLVGRSMGNMPPAAVQQGLFPQGEGSQPPINGLYPYGRPGLTGGMYDDLASGQKGDGSQFSSEVGSPSITRFFTTPLGVQLSWLLPFGLASLVLLALSASPHLPLEKEHKALLLWGGWLVTCLVFFSMASFFHAYYLIMLAPPLAVIVAGGVKVAWERRRLAWTAWVLATSAGITLIFQSWLAMQILKPAWWLFAAAGCLLLGIAGLVLARRMTGKGIQLAAYMLLILGMLVTPFTWSVMTVADQSPDVRLPTAFRSGSNSDGMQQPPGVNASLQGMPQQGPGEVTSSVVDYLLANTQDTKYLVAVSNANIGAPLVLATGRPVLYMGGFNGSDPVVDESDLSKMVAEGELRYVFTGDDRGGQSGINSWLRTTCTIVIGLDTGSNSVLYQCSGRD